VEGSEIKKELGRLVMIAEERTEHDNKRSDSHVHGSPSNNDHNIINYQFLGYDQDYYSTNNGQ